MSLSRIGRAAWLLLLGVACVCALALPAAAQSDAERALEHRVKAAFLYRYTEFVMWPDSAYTRADAPFVIVVAGPEAVAENLRSITAGRSVGARPIEVRRVAPGEPIPMSQVVYIAGMDPGRTRDLIRGAPRHALVVTEAEGALDYGSVINFVLLQDRVRFDISLESAEKRGLRLSSRLLAVARSVRGSQ